MNIRQSKPLPDPVLDYLTGASQQLSQLDTWSEIKAFSDDFETAVHELQISDPEVDALREQIKTVGDTVWERDHVFQTDEFDCPESLTGTARTVAIAKARRKHIWLGEKATAHRRQLELQSHTVSENLETAWSNRIGECETPEKLSWLEREFDTELEDNQMLQPHEKEIRQRFKDRESLLRQKNPGLFPEIQQMD